MIGPQKPPRPRRAAERTPEPEAPEVWLRPTRQLDLAHPRIHITAQKLTQAKQSHAARAAAIQDFVRRMPFAASSHADAVNASEVLQSGRGDCHSKGLLFTALCRAAGLPARLLFVDVRARFLAGLLPDGPASLPHAVGQVCVEGAWRSTDGYVVDPVLFARAKDLLRDGEADCGWGIVREATGHWDGHGDCLQQFRRDDVLRVFGAFHDPAGFYGDADRAPGWLGGLKYALGARLVNRRVAQVRRANAARA